MTTETVPVCGLCKHPLSEHTYGPVAVENGPICPTDQSRRAVGCAPNVAVRGGGSSPPSRDPLSSKECFYDRFEKMWHDLIGSPAQHTLRYSNCSGMFKEADEEIARLNGRVGELEDLLLKLASQRPAFETNEYCSECGHGIDHKALCSRRTTEPACNCDFIPGKHGLGHSAHCAVSVWRDQQRRTAEKTPAPADEQIEPPINCGTDLGPGRPVKPHRSGGGTLPGCQHDPMRIDCTLRHQFTAGRTRCDVCGGIFTLPVSTAEKTSGVDMSGVPMGDPHPCDMVRAGFDPITGKPLTTRAPEVCGCPYGNCNCDDGSSPNGKG